MGMPSATTTTQVKGSLTIVDNHHHSGRKTGKKEKKEYERERQRNKYEIDHNENSQTKGGGSGPLFNVQAWGKRSGSKVNFLASAAAAAAAFLGPSPRDASHCLEFDTQVAELASHSYIHTVVLEG